MIEWRSILMKDKKFEGGFRLNKGTPVYVHETKHGWTGSYYTDKGSCYSFALGEDEFSILQSHQTEIEQLVAMPDPPDPPEKALKEKEMARRRLEYSIERHRQTADELELFLKKEYE